MAHGDVSQRRRRRLRDNPVTISAADRDNIAYPTAVAQVALNPAFSRGSCRKAEDRPLDAGFQRRVCAMRVKAFAVLAVLSATSLPAFAQSYRGGDPCYSGGGNRQAVGAVLGAVVGGLLGNGVASHKNREEGALLGGVVGAVAGSEIGRTNARCAEAYSGPDRGFTDSRAPYPDQYSRSTYSDDLDGQYDRRDDYAYGSGGRYDDSHRNDHYSQSYAYDPDDRDNSRQLLGDDRLARGDDADRYPSRNVIQQCAPVRQRTRLPDGSVEVRVVEACRRATYGDWELQN